MESYVPTTASVAHVVAHLVSRNPDLLGRLGRAHELVQQRAVSWSPELGVHVVASQSNPLGTYAVSLPERSCACPDQPRAPRGWCKHILAVAILGMAEEYEARQCVAVDTSETAQAWRKLVRAYLAEQQQAAAVVA